MLRAVQGRHGVKEKKTGAQQSGCSLHSEVQGNRQPVEVTGEAACGISGGVRLVYRLA